MSILKTISEEFGITSEEDLYHAYANILEDTYSNCLFSLAVGGLGFTDMVYRTHGPVCQILQSETKRKLVCLPRGTFKSSLCCVTYPIWLLLNNPNLRILIDSELYTNSKNFLREIKAHLEGERLTHIYGAFKTDSNWNENEITINQRSIPRKEASITAAGIGTEKTGQHYDIIICDDLNGPQNSNTQEGRQRVVDHYKYLQAILEPTGTMVVVGTRYADDDIIGWILKNEVNSPKENLGKTIMLGE